MSTASTAFTVRFLRNGDTIGFQSNIYKDNGDGTTLFQVVDATSGSVTPNWGTTANQPIIQIIPTSANGYAVAVTSVIWSYDGTDLNFVLDGTNWVTASNDSRFKARINSSGLYELRVCANLASASVIGDKQISATITYRSNGQTGQQNIDFKVELAQGGSDSHFVRIGVQQLNTTTNKGGMTLGNVDVNGTNHLITETTLTANCYYGASTVSLGGDYRLDWYRDGVKLTGSETGVTISGANLTVTRDAVQGGSVFVAKLVRSNNVVAQDGQRIIDNADEYQVVGTAVNGQNMVGYENGTAKNGVYALTVTKNGGSISQQGITFAWTIYNALGVSMRTGTGATVTITPADCLVAGSSIDSDEANFDDVDVQVTATL